MIGFLLAIAVGFAVPYIEAPVVQPLSRVVERFIRLEPGEGRTVAFALAAILAGLLSVIFGSSNPFWVAVGLTLGYFLLRIVAAVREALDARR
jgi:hypothetical protein